MVLLATMEATIMDIRKKTAIFTLTLALTEGLEGILKEDMLSKPCGILLYIVTLCTIGKESVLRNTY